MEWFVEEPRRGQIALSFIALTLTLVIIWFGRRKLSVSVPGALMFLLLAAIAIPGAIPARPTAQRNGCIHNLRVIQTAKTQWAEENNKAGGVTPSENDLYGTNGTNGILRQRP